MIESLTHSLLFFAYAKFTRPIMRILKMFGGFFMNIKLVGTKISVIGAAVSVADQFVKSKNLEELVRKEVEKQLNKR